MPETYLHGYDSRVMRLDLERIRELLRRLGEPQKRLRFVHVAGTNGKGSTCAMLSSILQAAGYRTGLFTSPALERFSERIQVSGTPISEAALEHLTRQVNEQGEQMAEHPTEFEAAAALALLYFAQERCDLAVLEVGLGGGGDATNVIPPPELCVFTAMGLDHTRILGNSYAEIAQAKAGILKPGTRAVSCANQPVCERVFRRECRRLGVPLRELERSRLSHVEADLEGLSLCIQPYGTLRLPLLGQYQAENALLAVTAAEELQQAGWRISAEAIVTGLSQVRWPGRFELLRRKPLFLLDGSHNPQGVAATADSFRALLPERKPVILLGLMADKDIGGILHVLLPLGQRFVTVAPENPRAMDAALLAEKISAAGGMAEAASDIQAAVRRALALAGTDGAVLALGSLYFSGTVRHWATNVSEN